MKKLFAQLHYVLPYKKNAILSISFNILSVLFSVSSLVMLIPFLSILFGTKSPVPTKPISLLHLDLDNLFRYIIHTYGNLGALVFVSLGMIIFSFMRNLFAYLALHFQANMRGFIIKDIRESLYKKILDLPLSYFSNERKGDLMARMTNDVTEIEVSIVSSLEMIFRDPITIVIYLGLLIFMSPQLTLFIFILLPISALIIGRIGRSLRKKSFKSQSKLGSLLAVIEETLSGLRIIKAFTAENAVKKTFSAINDEYTRLIIKINRKRSLASPVGEFLGTIVMVIIMVYGAILILNKETSMKPESFLTYLATFYMIIEPAKRFSTAYYNIQKGLASSERIDFILKAENKIKEKKNAIEKTDFSQGIEFVNVSFKYVEAEVLKNINLKVEKGKTVALVGQSGSGKSTLVDLIPRFYDIGHGEILLDGINIKDYKISHLRGLMGIVNQDPILFNDSFYNNIAFGLTNTSLENVIEAAKVANAHDFILETPEGYYSNVGDRGSKLSGGQRQRVSIARALLKNPPILILDEATSALDTESERLVQEAIIKLMENRTSIIIAHRLSTIKHADEICVLHEGEIVERGKHDELLELNGYYRKLYDMQMF
jgi:ATP-binding cassette, subfamily B, bacterial MsbA